MRPIANWNYKPRHRTTRVDEVLVDVVALMDEEKAIFAFESGLVAAPIPPIGGGIEY